jgi:hypothetical protein
MCSTSCKRASFCFLGRLFIDNREGPHYICLCSPWLHSPNSYDGYTPWSSPCIGLGNHHCDMSCPLRFAQGSAPGKNHYHFSMYDVPLDSLKDLPLRERPLWYDVSSIIQDALAARGYVLGHHLTSNSLKCRHPSWCCSMFPSHCSLPTFN